MISSRQEFRTIGMSFVVQQYKSTKHSYQSCSCDGGFSITHASIDLSKWEIDLSIGNLIISPSLLYECSLLRKLLVSQPDQMNKIKLPWRFHQIIINLLEKRYSRKGFVACDFTSIPLDYSSYPSEA